MKRIIIDRINKYRNNKYKRVYVTDSYFKDSLLFQSSFVATGEQLISITN